MLVVKRAGALSFAASTQNRPRQGRRPQAPQCPPPTIRSPRPANPSPGISSCWRRTTSAASAAWAKAWRCRSPKTAAASSGWRMRAHRRISPASTSAIRASRKWWCRPTCRRPTCARTRWNYPATSWRSPIRRRKPGRSRRASNCSTCRCRKSRARFHSSTARARLRAACINCGSATANTCIWRRAPPTSRRATRSTTSSTAASTCATLPSPLRPAAGGCRAPKKARRRCRATNSTRVIARTTPMSINSGRTGFISPTSTAACSSWTSPTRRNRSRCRTGPIRRLTPASCTRRCRCSSAAS